MRWFGLLMLLLVASIAAELGAPLGLNVTDNITIPINVYGGSPGTRVVARWDNSRLNIFPSEFWLTSPNQALTFYLFRESGLCGTTNITFSLGESNTSTQLQFGTCVPVPISIPAMTPLERNYYDLKTKKIDTADKYLQITPEIQARIDEIQDMIAQTLSTQDFTQKDILAAQTKAKITDLDKSFPYINDMGESVDQQGTANLTEKLQAAFGDIEAIPALYYKRKTNIQVMVPGSSKEFTLYKLILLNSAVDKSVSFMIAEDISPAVTDTTPIYNASSLVVWNVTLKPKEIKTIKYGVYKRLQEPLSTTTFQIAEAPAPQSPEQEEPPQEEEQQEEEEPHENATQPPLPPEQPPAPPVNNTETKTPGLLFDNYLGILLFFIRLFTGK